MHKFLASILLFSFLGQTFNQGWYYLQYQIEKKEYMKRCENKSRPQLHCNGQCQLMKKIKAQEEKEKGQAPELKLAAKSLLVSPKNTFVIPSFNIAARTSEFLMRTIGVPVDRSCALFHPPDLS